MIGSTLSHFRITSKLGEGGMGVVYSAEDLTLQRPVALKVLSSEVLAREDMRARFLREARTAAALNHPHICTIYEVGEVDEVPFIAMERIDGEGLDERMSAATPMPLREIERLALQIAEGLAAAHAQGIVHRDLKPGNVRLTREGQVKILDFGLAKPLAPAPGDAGETALAQTITAEMTREGTVLGTVSYMSPEQAAGREVDSRSDVFSFGVLLYEMTTGRRPFTGDTSAATMAKVLEADPVLPSEARRDVPADLERIIRRCLEKRPAHRYNDTRDLVADLRSLQATGETAAVRPAPVSTRKPLLWVALAAAAIGLTLLALLGPWSREDAAPPPPAAAAALPSIAVLPFHNLSAEAENDYFSAGMTEEIISKLSRIDGLEVASRSSVATFTDRARDVQQIGRDLGVLYLLDGSVRRAGDRVRVSAQLVDGATGRNVWSEDFDGSLEDVFAMQEKTALAIAERLDLELSPQEQQDVERRATQNVAAYDAYLRGMAVAREWGIQDRLEEAIAHFERAIELDPGYAAAYAGIAFVEADMYRVFDPREERIESAEAHARRAVELDPTMPDAPHALGLIAGNRFDYHRSVDLLRQAVQLAPKEARYWDNLSWALAYQTPPDGEASLAAADEAIRLQPHFPGAYYHRARALIALGRPEEARRALETLIEQDPEFSSRWIGMAQYHLAVGEYDDALALLDQDERQTTMVRYYRAATLAAAGKTDAALAELERVLEMGFRDFVTLEGSAYFDGVRGDPRFGELIRRYR